MLISKDQEINFPIKELIIMAKGQREKKTLRWLLISVKMFSKCEADKKNRLQRKRNIYYHHCRVADIRNANNLQQFNSKGNGVIKYLDNYLLMKDQLLDQ